jgi:hypothetical protein
MLTLGAGRGAKLGRGLRQSQAAYLLLAPSLILFAVILAYPLLRPMIVAVRAVPPHANAPGWSGICPFSCPG